MASAVQANGRIVHRCARGFPAFHPGYLLTGALIILGLTVAPSAATSNIRTQANNSPKHRGVACPSQQFKVFLEAFSENAKLQRVFIKFPVQIRYVGFNDVENDYEFQSKKIESYNELMPPGEAVWRGPFPNRKERKRERLVMTIERRPASAIKRVPDDTIVKVELPGSDNVTLYHFQRTSNCWKLHIIETFSPPT